MGTGTSRFKVPVALRISLSIVLISLLLRCDHGALSSPDEVLTIAVRADVTGIFPNSPVQAEAFTLHLNSNVFEGLVRFDKNMNPEGAIAESWENLDDYTWSFHLRKGIRFSNGEPVRAEDVVSSIQATLKRPFVTAGFLLPIRSVEAVGSDRVEITTNYPDPLLLSNLAIGFILPKSALAKNPIEAIGTGPYMVERWIPGSELILVQNRNYWGPAPAFRRVRFLVESDANKRIKELLDGKVQIADNIPLEQLSRLQSNRSLYVISRPGTRVVFLTFRMNRPPFSNIKLRHAIELAIDREELIRNALHGRAEVASQLVPTQVAGYNPEIKVPQIDREQAKKLLAEAGYPNGLSIRLDGTKDRYVNDVQIMNEVARQLGLIGINVTVNAMPKKEFFPFLAAGKSDFTLVGFSCETLNASLALDMIMRSPHPDKKINQNYQGLSDPELDRLIDLAWREPSLKTRTEYYAQALKRIADIRAIVPLEVQPETIAMSNKVIWEPPITFGLRMYDASLRE
ncbi:MAG TPA: ABC transporter substrate-binding protein [Acidobacteriota bacterium]|nr:ABC transporter substrate-binding protein [Acidobacteriota bacterium]